MAADKGQRDPPSSNLPTMVLFAAVTWATLALLAIILFSVSGPGGQRISLSILIAEAAASVGALAGFLFAVPKSVIVKRAGKSSRRAYDPNSNLEQISDWLTKIIVGVGLIEFRQLIEAMRSVATRLGPSFGDQPGGSRTGAIYGLMLIVCGLLISFLVTYMWTRTRLLDVLSKQEEMLNQDQPVIEDGPSDTTRPVRTRRRFLGRA